ncbi:MAG: glycosyltransferase family 2 protein, partial [Alphaproteobacteria bacterium]|nr:glycosyltransferase family 2 protein [Alphaproteobacteria bacterium]
MKKKAISLLCLILAISGGYFLWLKSVAPLVSVVMPVYNRENYVKEALDSILNQSFQDFEVIVVDDGSTDKTLSVLQEYAEKDSRIHVYAHEKNCGVGCARNTAQSHAIGKYLAIMDSDDVMVPQRLERQVRAMEENPDIDAISGRLVNLADPFEQTWAERPFEYRLSQPDNGFLVCLFFANCFGNAGSIIRHSFVKKHDIKYKEQIKVGEDYDYWLQMTVNDGTLAYMGD